MAEHGDRLTLRLTGMEPEESLPALTRGETDLAVTHSYDLLPFALPPTSERHDLLTDPVVVAPPADDPACQEPSPAISVILEHLITAAARC